jgi:hypothetical protein
MRRASLKEFNTRDAADEKRCRHAVDENLLSFMDFWRRELRTALCVQMEASIAPTPGIMPRITNENDILIHFHIGQSL